MLLSDDGGSRENPMISSVKLNDEENEEQPKITKREVSAVVEEKDEAVGKPSFLIQQDD